MLLVGVLAVPLLVLTGAATWYSYASARSAQRQMLLSRATSAAAILDSELRPLQTGLRVLGASPFLAEGDLPGFETEMRLFAREFGGALVDLIRPGGTVAFSSYWPAGKHVSGIVATPFARKALADNRPKLSNLVFDPVSHRWWIGAALPVQVGRNGPHWLLTLYLPQTRIADGLRALGLPGSWTAVIADRLGNIVARTPADPGLVGKPATPDLRAAMQAQASGLLPPTHHRSDGTLTAAAFAVSQLGYHAAVGLPAAEFARPQRDAVIRTALLALLISAAAILISWLIGSSVVRPLRRLAASPFDARPSGVPEIDRLARTLAEARQRQIEDDRTLRESEERLELATGAAGIGIWDWNLLDNSMRYSERAKAISGLPAGEPVTLEQIHAVTHPDDLKFTIPLADSALDPKRRERPVFEYRLKLPDGTLRWVTAAGHAVFANVNGAERAVRFVGTIQDITGRKRIEEELRTSEGRLQLALSAGRMAVWEYDVASDSLIGSRDLYKVLGFPEEARPGKAEVRAGCAPVDRERIKIAAIAALARGERFFEVDFGYASPAGDRRWMLMRADIGCNEAGVPERVIGVLMDMTAVKRTEMALRDNEERLRELVATLDLAAVFTRDLDGTIRFWSKGCERLYGWPASVAVGSSAHALLRTEFPVSAEATQGELEATGEWVGDLLQHRRDGFQITVAVHKVLRRDEQGRPLAVMESVADVTALRTAKEELQRLNEELEERVRSEVLAREAAQARAAHAERMQALGQLAGGIAHDFNNVLQAVTGAASLVERRPGQPEQVSRFARLILDAVARGSAITRRLLAFARRGDLRAERVAPVEMLEGLKEILSHTLGSGVSIAIRTEADLPEMMVDRGQLETVLVNLATNARDAMPGGGQLTLAAELRRAQAGGPAGAHGLPPGDYIAVSVTDTGTGMDAATIEHATEPFFTTKRRGEGTGLGLAMAKGFAEQSGGALLLQSEVGQGTTVTLLVPSASERASPRPAPVPSWQTGENVRVRVLLVDDDPLVRQSLAAQLELAGFSVATAPGGPAALALLRAGEPADALVTDLSMPDMDGLSLIRAAQSERARLPAVLLTGYAGDSAALAIGGAVSGAFSLLRKPVSGHQLADRILALMEASRATA